MMDAGYCFWTTFTLALYAGSHAVDVSSSYEGTTQTENHVWSIGVPQLNITFSSITTGNYFLSEINSTGSEIFFCSVRASSAGCFTDKGCVCSPSTSPNMYQAVYSMDLTENKNLSTVKLDTSGSVPTTLAEALIILESCPSQEQAELEVLSSCIPNHFNCPVRFFCGNGYSFNESYSTCLADASWNSTIKCTPGICCACLGGIVIIAISISGSISCIVVIILLGSDFVKGQIVICVVGGCSMILGIVCGAVPLRSCSNYVIWIGGDIASIALGSIGTFVTLIFLGYLIVVRCKPEYSLGKR